jgi:hypothetical protein
MAVPRLLLDFKKRTSLNILDGKMPQFTFPPQCGKAVPVLPVDSARPSFDNRVLGVRILVLTVAILMTGAAALAYFLARLNTYSSTSEER